MIISKRQFITQMIAALSQKNGRLPRTAVLTSNAQTVEIGAIRWDAWYDRMSKVGQAVERSLEDPKYHYRLPFFARVDNQGKISIDGGSLEVIDQEISYARKAGLTFWAFVAYEEHSALDTGLRIYLQHSQSALKFCMISNLTDWGTPHIPSEMIQRHVGLMSDKRYLKVSDGRPVYFLSFITQARIQANWGSLADFKKRLDAFRHDVEVCTSRLPYVVLMDPVATTAFDYAHELGCDAISFYAYSPRADVATPFSLLAERTEAEWANEAKTGLPVVPTVMTGWDQRPRAEHPFLSNSPAKNLATYGYYVPATAKEIAVELQDAVHWVRSQKVDAVKIVLIYAWNENDEGFGAIIPTYGPSMPDTSRIEEICRVLK